VLNVKVEHPENAQPWSIGINKILTVRGGLWKATEDRMAGNRGRVLRTVSALALLAVVAAGCGSSQRSSSSVRGLPRALAGAWATQASTIAAAAAGGNSCRARRLANSLRTEIISAGGKVPERLRNPLLESVNSLANRITCTPPAQEVTPAPPKGPPQPGKKPKPPKRDDRGHGGHEGDG
jgi:hypothetical protein